MASFQVTHLLSIVDSSPNDLETPLGLQLDDAYIQLLIEQCRGMVRANVGIGPRCDDVVDCLVQCALEDGFGLTSVIGGGESELNGVMTKVFAHFH